MAPVPFDPADIAELLPAGGRVLVTGASGESVLLAEAVMAAGEAIGAILVYENTWAAPFATALRKAGASLIANGRIPVNALIAALEEEENA